MVTVSLCMIVKNEEKVLARCLNSSSKIADEIVIVDTGSTDATKTIARRFTDKVYDFKWIDDFAAARNFSFAFGTKDYLMWLDADDVIDEKNAEKILLLKESLDPSTDAVTMKYAISLDDNGDPTVTSTRGRLFKRGRGFLWRDAVHEYVPLFGKIHDAGDIFITHRHEHKVGQLSDRNLKIYRKKLERGNVLSPRGQYYYARELKDHGLYAEAVDRFNLFLDGGEGWIEDNIGACFSLAICYNALNLPEKAKQSLIRSFNYDAPRAEICCLLGYHYKEKGDFKTAAAWFETALKLPETDTSGFQMSDYKRFIPAVELSVCFDRLKLYAKASAFNDLAGTFKPTSQVYLQNKKYFEERLRGN